MTQLIPDEDVRGLQEGGPEKDFLTGRQVGDNKV